MSLDRPERIYPPRLREIEEAEEELMLASQERRRRWVTLLLFVTALLIATPFLLPLARNAIENTRSGGDVEEAGTRLPDGLHIQIEVLNAGGVPGAAAAMAERLRADGFDVPSVDNAADPEPRTIVLDRRGDTTAIRYLCASLDLPIDRVIRQIDSSKYVAATVLVGRR